MRQTPDPGRRIIPLPFDWPAYRAYARSVSTARLLATIGVIVIGGVVGVLVMPDRTAKIIFGALIGVSGLLGVVPALIARRGIHQ